MLRTSLPALVVCAMVPSLCAGGEGQLLVSPNGAQIRVTGRDVPISADALVVFTQRWGAETPDNRWTRSCTIIDDTVTATSIGATPIPGGGFVITGHGSAAGWLGEHLKTGDAIELVALPPFAEEVHSRDVDAVDPSTPEFPSGRGADQLVIYTAEFGARTGTNIFGSESIVRRGRIVGRSGGDSLIPADGFVISGHGTGSRWNVNHCPIGARVHLDGLRLTVAMDRRGHFLRGRHDVDRARERIAWAAAEAIDCPLQSAKEALAEAQRLLGEAWEMAGVDGDKAETMLGTARRLAWIACARASETRTVEARGVWIGERRALDTAPQRAAYFTNLRSANITMILPLAGRILDQPGGEQLLRDVIADAHAFGIEVHPWTWLPAHSIPRSRDAARLETHPDWADVSADGKPLATLDLANPDARAAIVADAVRLATEFDIDGLHMDWEGMGGGFSKISRAEFQAQHGYDPLGADGPTGPERTRDRYLWRVALVDRVVSEITAQLRALGREIPVSSAVQCFALHSNIASDHGASHQWLRWAARGQLDIACPMLYAQIPEWVQDTATAITEGLDGQALHYAGLILYPETAQSGLLEPFQLLEQIDAARAGGCTGIVLFAGQHLFSQPWAPDDRLLLTLREGPFREPSENPHTTRNQRPLQPDASVPYLYAVATPSTLGVRVRPGQTAGLTISVKNWGTDAFRVTDASIVSPRGWRVDAEIQGSREIRPGGEVTIPVTIHAPADDRPVRELARMSITVRTGAGERAIAVPGVQVTVSAEE